jgi:FAD/FMN-containing dehydrogenase
LPYTAVQSAFDPFFPKGHCYYWKSINVHNLSDVCIDTLLAAAATRPSQMSDIPIWHLGGAMSRVAPAATAYGRRDAPYLVTAESTWTDGSQNETNIRWARDLVAAMRPFSQGGSYLNFAGLGEDREALLRDAYGANYDRLAALKTAYDPGNLFRMNLNIPPAQSVRNS